MNNTLVQNCSNCQRSSKNLLLLACIHDICFSCAGKHINNSKRVNNEFYYRCHVCKIHTLLQKETADRLQNQSLSEVLDPQMSKQSRVSLNSQKRINVSGCFDPRRQQIDQPRSKRQNTVCSLHEEPLNYICMDCGRRLICSQCALNGQHNGHKAVHTKRALPMLKQKMGHWIQRLRDNNFKLLSTQSQLQAQSKRISKIHFENKTVISRKFKEIRENLDLLESEAIGDIDEWMQRQTLLIQEILMEIDVKKQSLARVVKNICDELQSKHQFQFFINFPKLAEMAEKELAPPESDLHEIQNPPSLALANQQILHRLKEKLQPRMKNQFQ